MVDGQASGSTSSASPARARPERRSCSSGPAPGRWLRRRRTLAVHAAARGGRHPLAGRPRSRRTSPASTAWRSRRRSARSRPRRSSPPPWPWACRSRPGRRCSASSMAAPGRIGVGVTGTHGKSTTTALLGHLLTAAGLDPTVEVGAFIPAWGASVRPGAWRPFVVEADEFGDNFLELSPRRRDRHERRDGPSRLLRRCETAVMDSLRAVRARHARAIRRSAAGCCCIGRRPGRHGARRAPRRLGGPDRVATVPVARWRPPT